MKIFPSLNGRNHCYRLKGHLALHALQPWVFLDVQSPPGLHWGYLSNRNFSYALSISCKPVSKWQIVGVLVWINSSSTFISSNLNWACFYFQWATLSSSSHLHDCSYLHVNCNVAEAECRFQHSRTYFESTSSDRIYLQVYGEWKTDCS